MKKGVGSGAGSGAGSGTGSISQRYGSGDPDPDPYQNVTDPQHWVQCIISSLDIFANLKVVPES
jgi:hypothetical protein